MKTTTPLRKRGAAFPVPVRTPYLFGMEVSIFVTVGDGDGVEVLVRAGVGHKPVQRSLELGAARGLGVNRKATLRRLDYSAERKRHTDCETHTHAHKHTHTHTLSLSLSLTLSVSHPLCPAVLVIYTHTHKK